MGSARVLGFLPWAGRRFTAGCARIAVFRLVARRLVEQHGITRVELVDTQLFSDLPGGERRHADLVLKPQCADPQRAEFLIHVEIQSQVQSIFPRRMFAYSARLHEKYWLPVFPIALFTYLREAGEMGVYDIRVAAEQEYGLSCSFYTIELQRLNWRRYQRQRSPVAAAFMARMARKAQESVEVKVQCLRSMLGLNLDDDQAALLWAFVETYVPLDAQETRRYNQIREGWPVAVQREADRIMSSIERRGWEKGRAEGVAKGRAEGRRETLLRQLQVKFGEVPAEDRALLERLSEDQLEELSIAVLTADSYTEWRVQLQGPSQDTD